MSQAEKSIPPHLWQKFYPRAYAAPGGWGSPRSPSMVFLTASLEQEMDMRKQGKPTSVVREAICSCGESWRIAGCPLFWACRDWLEAVSKTRVDGVDWPEAHLPFEGCAVMLPKGFVVEMAMEDGVEESEMEWVAFSRHVVTSREMRELLFPCHPGESLKTGIAVGSIRDKGTMAEFRFNTEQEGRNG